MLTTEILLGPLLPITVMSFTVPFSTDQCWSLTISTFSQILHCNTLSILFSCHFLLLIHYTLEENTLFFTSLQIFDNPLVSRIFAHKYENIHVQLKQLIQNWISRYFFITVKTIIHAKTFNDSTFSNIYEDLLLILLYIFSLEFIWTSVHFLILHT